MSDRLNPPVLDTDDGFEVLTVSHRVTVRASTGDAVWVETLDESGDAVLVPRADLVAVAAALLTTHTRLAMRRDPQPTRRRTDK